MNRKEAYSRIDAIIEKHEVDDEYVTITSILDYDALRFARKLLEQEPCEDAISREDALMCLTGEIKDTDTIETIIARFVRRIRKLPHVNPQPKTGHWIFVDKAHEHAHCSECDYGDVDLMDGRPHNYCPNCGARMIEPQERSEKG